MYTLRVVYPDDPAPRETAKVQRGADALTRIQGLLAAHAGCERIDVMFDTVRLFSVDCKGNRIDR